MNPDEERHAPQDELPGSVVSPRGVQPRPELTVEYRRLREEYDRLRAEGVPAEQLILPLDSDALTEYHEPDGTTHKMREDGLAIVVTGEEQA